MIYSFKSENLFIYSQVIEIKRGCAENIHTEVLVSSPLHAGDCFPYPLEYTRPLLEYTLPQR